MKYRTCSNSTGNLQILQLRLPEKALFPGAQYRFVLNVSDSNNPSRRSKSSGSTKNRWEIAGDAGEYGWIWINMDVFFFNV